MTKEEAIKELRHISDDMRGNWKKAIDMAIKALEKEPCEDAISRQTVLDTIESWLSCKDYNKAERHIMRAVRNILYEFPPVNPQPKTGHWIVNECGNIFCSECGCSSLYDKVYPGESVFGKAIRVKSTFCPTCGAKMVETQESEDKEWTKKR